MLVERRGKTIAALVTPETVTTPAPQAASERLLIDPRAIGAFCARHGVKVLYLFGSALTDRSTRTAMSTSCSSRKVWEIMVSHVPPMRKALEKELPR